MQAMDRISIRTPDDFHVHLRDGAMLKQVAQFTARQFARAIVMPNLEPPVVTTEQALAYKSRIAAALPDSLRFTPQMTSYLTEESNPVDIEARVRRWRFGGLQTLPCWCDNELYAGSSGHRASFWGPCHHGAR